MSSSAFLRIAAFSTCALFAATPALAGVVSTPAPLLAAGIPALAIFGAGYWGLKRFRRD